MHIYSQRYIGCLENGFQRMIWNFTYSLLRFCSFKPFTYILCIWSINYLSPRQFFLFLKRWTTLMSSFRFPANWIEEGRNISCGFPALTHAQSPHHDHPRQRVHLLQVMELRWHVIITQSPWFISGFTLSAVCSLGIDKCIMTCIYCHSIIKKNYSTLNILFALPIPPPL